MVTVKIGNAALKAKAKAWTHKATANVGQGHSYQGHGHKIWPRAALRTTSLVCDLIFATKCIRVNTCKNFQDLRQRNGCSTVAEYYSRSVALFETMDNFQLVSCIKHISLSCNISEILPVV